MVGLTAFTRSVLVVGRSTGNCRVIEEATQPWMFETVACSSIQESKDILDKQDFVLIFCEESGEDGTYRDLLSMTRTRKVPVAVMLSDTNQELVFREAMALGAFGVVGSPCSKKDVQWMVIRATQRESATRSSF